MQTKTRAKIDIMHSGHSLSNVCFITIKALLLTFKLDFMHSFKYLKVHVRCNFIVFKPQDVFMFVQ